MAGNLTDMGRKWILKQNRKKENSEPVRETFVSLPPTRLRIYRIRDKFIRTESTSPKRGHSDNAREYKANCSEPS